MNTEILKLLIGTRIKESRKKKEFTQEDLSEKADTAVAQISKLERGLCCRNVNTAWRLADALQVSVGWLMGEGEPENSEPDIDKLLREKRRLEGGLQKIGQIVDNLKQ